VLDNAMADFMVRDVSNDEVKSVIFSIGDDRAPGPDGFTAAFFKKAWDVVGGDITCTIRDFFSNGKLLKKLNHTIISLIPKIIANRVKEGLGDIVSINQSAFVPGRRISDNILLTQELMRNYNRRRGPPKYAFKVDIQKACKRGLRQGDPLSPYLFTLVMEILTLILQRRMRDSDDFQYHHLCEQQRIINLCFADDLFLFSHGEMKKGKAKVMWDFFCMPKHEGGLAEVEDTRQAAAMGCRSKCGLSKTAVSILSRLVLAATSYYIWLERNGILFKKKILTPDQIVDVIISMVRLKLVTFKFKKMSTGSYLLLDQWKIPSYCIVHDGSTSIFTGVPTIFDHARIEATLNDMLSNQFRYAEEYAYHLEQATNFMENQIVWESRQEDIRRPIPKPLVFNGPQRNPNEPPRYLYNNDLFFLKNGNTEEKKYVLSLHKIHAELFPEADLEEMINCWVQKEFKNFNEDARLSIQHWKDSWHKRVYK
ncbi:sodium/hydrogen exchanger 6, partial [Tanacetum coccineum]